jgi:GNAT superfamily N-acetyltransferase
VGRDAENALKCNDMLKIIIPKTQKELAATKALSKAYLQWLTQEGGISTCYLNEQNAFTIVEALPLNHEKPNGCLLLATWQNEPAGTVAITKIDDTLCEMKRLYVNPECQKHKIGTQLINCALRQAKALGYSTMRLDTLPKTMSSAYHLYLELGFLPIEKYNGNTTNGVVFMEKYL